MDIDILRKAVDILNELIDEKIWSKKKVDGLDEWKALEPGRKVLHRQSKHIFELTGIRTDKARVFCGEWDAIRDDGQFGIISQDDIWQIIPIGPFDGEKLRVGDWVWVEGQTNPDYTGWATIWSFDDADLAIDMGHWPHKNYHIHNGQRLDWCGKGQLHYYPPSLDIKETEEQRKDQVYDELARDKVFVAHAIKFVSGELMGAPTCPNYTYVYTDYCGIAANGHPHEATPCYKMYATAQKCPCIEFGEHRVKSDLIKIISRAAGV